MKLLFITHKIHELDDDFAFASLWVQEFMRQGIEVQVICLEQGVHTAPFIVHSLGKERGKSNLSVALRFFRLITTLRYDRVFVHMNPKWVMAGAWYWWYRKIPIYLWYTHYTMHLPLRVSHFFCRRLFAATKESMPHYEGDPKKIVTGHGVDTRFWDMEIITREARKPRHELLAVHRICRSKRLHLAITALTHLPDEYTLTVYGRVLEQDYYGELMSLIAQNNLRNRVTFKGSVPMPALRAIYPQFQIMVNMAPETIDKTIVEGMLAGVQPITTRGNAEAIGLPHAPSDDSPQSIATYIINLELLPIHELQTIAATRHSLESLIFKMLSYISYGD